MGRNWRWDSAPYARKHMHYRHYELMHLLDGEVVFEDEASASATFRNGSIFLMRQDTECT